GTSGQGGGGGAGGSSGAGGEPGGMAGASGAGAGGAGAGGAAGAGAGGVGGAACGPAEVSCGGKCVDTKSDVSNCGQCGKACEAGAACCEGACVEVASCAFAVTKLGVTFGWQSGGEFIKLQGKGFAKGMKVFIGDGRAPVRVIDEGNALIQTPPGPAGDQDVRVELGGATAKLPKGFKYISAGLTEKWEQKPMQIVRGEDPALTVLQDGRVLIAGGTKVPDSTAEAVATAEIYNRSTDTVSSAASTMGTPRWQNSAITLLDGRALVVGGACFSNLTNCNGDPKKADLFDPATDTFLPLNDLNVGRAYTRTALLPDGRVLIASANTADLEIFDPETGGFTLVPHAIPHVFGVLIRLRDGRVLLAGGDGGNTAAEIFDPETGTLTSTGPLNQGRSKLTAHTLPDGRVIFIGGASSSAGGITNPMTTIELYDPATGTFSVAPYQMATPRTWHASALLRDGRVLAMGGYTLPGQCGSLTAAVDRIDPVAGEVVPFPETLNKNTEWGAVTLLDGSVLAVGGGACGTSLALPDIFFLAGKE
ncbi:MAG: IPT/TIG domain-containing protein, partial [Polyangiaceae bacterium]|nr:IPT/TIG domain-containing protein [Polyangiaceae bacterium]